MNSFLKRKIDGFRVAFFSMLLAVGFLLPAQRVFAKDAKPTHGSSAVWIEESMLKNTVPADYKVNPDTQGSAMNGDYNKYFLKDDIQTISIEIDEDNLNFMFQNALDKPTVMANKVTIGDEAVCFVGLKTKGDFTLLHSFTDNKKSDRFSMSLNFGKYVKKKDFGETQNFHGVKKISLNNFFFDKSMMKEYCSLLLMQKMGVPTPQFGLTKLYINGEYYGVYSMIESLDSPILEQYYQTGRKEISDYLLKPEGTNFLYKELEEDWSPMWERDESTLEDVEEMLPTVKEWVKRLNLLSEGKDFDGNKIDVESEEYIALLDQIIDTDEFLRYFAAHSFLCQTDNMFVNRKNFGLYVGKDGKALMLPWDYDLSFGCYSPVTADTTANYNVDLMFVLGWGEKASNMKMKYVYRDFPLFNVIYHNKELMERYHTYMLDCSKIMALGGTTSFGETFEPLLCTKSIEKITDSLTEAVNEPVTKRASYMNGIVQPRDLKGGLMHLPKIIMMRAVGVYNQLMKNGSHVSGRGCNLSFVGNGQDNFNLQVNGVMTAVNAEYGLFTTARYAGESPMLTVREIGAEDERYQRVASAVKPTEKGLYKVYFLGDAGMSKVKSEYTISIPFGEENEDVRVYKVDEDKVSALFGEWSDGILSVKADDLGIFVIKEAHELSALQYGLIVCLISFLIYALCAIVWTPKREA